MPKRQERLPPSARKVALLSVLALAGYGLWRLFIGRLLPSTAASNLVPQGLSVAFGALACALFFYWLARMRYARGVLHGQRSLAAAALAALGLAAAAACLQWGRAPAPLDAATALPRAAGLAGVLCASAAEEYGFRGSLFRSLQELGGRSGTALALAAGSLGFALLHWGYQGTWVLPFAAAAGLALGVARLRGAPLAALVAAHALMDGVDAAWLSPSLSQGYWTSVAAAVAALAVAALLALLPKAPPPALPRS